MLFGLRASAGRLSNDLSFYLLLSADAVAIVMFGATKPLVADFLCIPIGLALVFSPKRLFSRDVRVAIGFAALLSASYVALAAINTDPWWQSDVGVERALAILGRLDISRSVILLKEMRASSNALLFLATFVCAAIVGMNTFCAGRALRIFRYFAFVYVFYAIVSHAIAPDFVLWERKIAYQGVLTATFVNRNTAATFIGVCVILFFVSASYKVRPWLPELVRYGLWGVSLPSRVSRSLMIDTLGLIASMVALFLTESRAGVVLTCVTLIALGLLMRKYLFRNARWPARITALVLAALFALAILLSGRLLERIARDGAVASPRLEAYRSMLPIIAAHPLHGTGVGSFADLYPTYRPQTISMMGVWDVAHSTPLELAIEDGVPFAVMIVIAWSMVLIALVRKSLGPSRLATIAAGAWGLAGLHSAVDFSMQIPGISMAIATLAGLSIGRPQRPPPLANSEAESVSFRVSGSLAMRAEHTTPKLGVDFLPVGSS